MKIKTKQYKRRILVFGSLSCLVIMLFIYNLISYISVINNLSNEIKDKEKILLDLEVNNKITEEVIEKLKDPDYLAKFARENYLYSKDGEYVIRIDKDDKLVIEVNEDRYKTNEKIIYILGLLIGVIIIYIIVKVKRRKS